MGRHGKEGQARGPAPTGTAFTENARWSLFPSKLWCPLTQDKMPPTVNVENQHRRSIRLRGYDYSRAGAYFITICTQHRKRLFGDIVADAMILNDAGRMIQTVWDEIPLHYVGTDIDEFVIMPNHIHGIIIIVGAPPRGCPVIGGQENVQPLANDYTRQKGQPQGVPL